MELELTVIASKDSMSANSINHTLLHIGAGEGQDIERQLAGKPKRLILVEPNPDIAARLRDKTRAWSNVEVHEIAVIASVKDEQLATLHEYNWNTASSLQETAQLEQLFPGLRLVRNHQVKALSPVALIERLALDRGAEHALVIETAAAEGGIVEALCDSGDIGLFSSLTLSCPGPGLYAGGADLSGLLTRLADYGFETVEQDESDPDWPVFGLKRNRWRYELQQAEQRLKMLEVQLSELQEEKRTLDRALTERGHELDEKTKLIDEKEVQLEQTVQARNAQAKLAAERQEELEQLKTENATQSSRVRELDTKLTQFTTDYDEQKRLAAERQVQIGKLTETRQAETKLRAELEAKLEQAAKARDEQARVAAERQAQVEKLTAARETETKLRAELEAKLEQAAVSRDEQARLAAERQAQVGKLTETSKSETNLRTELEAKLEQASKALDEQARVAAECQAQVGKLTETSRSETNLRTELEAKLEQTTKSRDEQARLAAERQAQVETLTKTREAEKKLRAELEAKLEQTAKARDEQVRLVIESQRRVSELESHLAEAEQRQALMAEEMHRAEGQIDLITDVLLREPGL